MTTARLLPLLTLAALAALLPGGSVSTQGGPAISSLNGFSRGAQLVTIIGSGFGAKAAAGPLKFDNFEAGAPGQDLRDWDLIQSMRGNNPVYSTRRLRPNSKGSAEARFVNGNYLSSFGINRGQQSLPRIYFDAWYFFDARAPFPRNHKPIRIHAGGEGRPNMYLGMWCAGHDSSVVDQDGVEGAAATVSVWSDLTAEYFAQTWRHIQGYVEQSSPNMADGTVQVWIDGALKFSRVKALLTRNGSAQWNTIWFGNYLGHDRNEGQRRCGEYGDAWTLWDDVYVDVTAARVELGDAPTYGAAKHREIQIPTDWSDSRITIALNPGSFTSLDGHYLYVIDERGRSSAGMALRASR